MVELEHSLGPGDVAQTVEPEVTQGDFRRQAGEGLRGRFRADDLTGMRRGPEAGAPVRHGSVVIAGAQLRLTRVDRGAHSDLAVRGPWLALQGSLGLDCGSGRVASVCEDREGRVTFSLALHEHAAGVTHDRADQLFVPRNRRPRDIGPLFPHARRTLDVGHEERDHTRRERSSYAHDSCLPTKTGGRPPLGRPVVR
jgi:hypothetical protein